MLSVRPLYSGLTLNIAANYGGRWDIIEGVKKLAEQVQEGLLRPDQITEESLTSQLCMQELAPVDLVIRTGGLLIRCSPPVLITKSTGASSCIQSCDVRLSSVIWSGRSNPS